MNTAKWTRIITRSIIEALARSSVCCRTVSRGCSIEPFHGPSLTTLTLAGARYWASISFTRRLLASANSPTPAAYSVPDRRWARSCGVCQFSSSQPSASECAASSMACAITSTRSGNIRRATSSSTQRQRNKYRASERSSSSLEESQSTWRQSS